MYVPSSNAEHRLDVVHDFMQAHPLGALVTATEEGLFATHLPFVLHRERGPYGTLEGHVARANPHHRLRATIPEGLVIFQGPDAYVTPSWYATKAEHGKVVPTWNYLTVHAYGTARFRDDHEFLRRHLETLTARHERGRARPWSQSDAPPEYIAGLERAIVGVELEITRLEAKWKMSQNRSDADIDGVVRGLAESAKATDREVGEIVGAVRPRRERTS